MTGDLYGVPERTPRPLTVEDIAGVTVLRPGDKLVIHLRALRITATEADAAHRQIQAILGPEVPALIVDGSADVYVLRQEP